MGATAAVEEPIAIPVVKVERVAVVTEQISRRKVLRISPKALALAAAALAAVLAAALAAFPEGKSWRRASELVAGDLAVAVGVMLLEDVVEPVRGCGLSVAEPVSDCGQG